MDRITETEPSEQTRRIIAEVREHTLQCERVISTTRKLIDDYLAHRGELLLAGEE